ncbi:putative protein fam50a [Cardiosporidium cionae]|uniref:FAM50A/XAP5 C-terminal domain-containing protein n=1 Tax=Cardiosporidium cionae TaxID=476202 RepID=A0ABQ7J9J1_9APIC|nr:putative protein fam50a [Cardiosporidium cionae]|eukprot:KAF8820315.1 putative protein fam50a [Cardiosporidium cionae]
MDFNINNESGNAVLQTIHSSEGGRAFKLIKQRQKMQQELEAAKNQIESSSAKRKHQVEFGGSAADKYEDQFRKETIGLVSAEEFREKRQKLSERIEAGEKKKHLSHRIYLYEDEREEMGSLISVKSKHLGKDPSVDTHFLADPERDARLRSETQKLIEKYYTDEEKIKQEILEVTYSYWDGTGHRRSIRVNKGVTIAYFLDLCRKDLERDFHELRTVATENLMYIKEDLVLPHNTTFYDLIKSKARGKSGPLFHFDVHDDIRMMNDVRFEKDESHAGKIVDRKWYERNRHIFPASRWETYNPLKTYETYTTHGHKDFSKESSDEI